jgi:2-oxoglutarate ferredoxin oxidoreductase subunit alpha
MSETAVAPDAAGAAKAPPLVVRFAGDSGDGIQLAGYEFAKSTADAKSDFMTFPDYPAEIRAPIGSLFGVSAFQIQFGADEVLTPGDKADVLVAFNPAALITNLQNLKTGGVLIVDDSHFDARGLKKAKLESNPLEDGMLDGYQVITVDVVKRTIEALDDLDLGRKAATRAKNLWVLGLVYWMFGRPLDVTKDWLTSKFKKEPEVAQANITALKAGHAYGETLEISAFPNLSAPRVARHHTGKARIISGAQAMALGLAAVAALGKRDIVYCSYPITPASTLLHALARFEGGVRTFQAEDEIAAISAALGASFAGSLGVTASSGPGLSLKTEAMGLGISVELPLLVIDVQRGGPSTGMPTKPEQSDLTMAIHGRHGEAPLPVLAPATPDECFWIMIEAARIAIETMSPVIILTDAYLANAASDWELPDIDGLEDIDWPAVTTNGEDFQPFTRDPETLARPWVAPGTPQHAHRIGGIEKAQGSGHISYDPSNHQEMTRARAEKVSKVADRLPPIELEDGPEDGDILVIGWGSTHGSIAQTVKELNAEGKRVSHVHLRHLWPLPRGLEDLIKRFPKVVTAELNTGQLSSILRSEYLAPVTCISQVNGQPFYVSDLKDEITKRLEAPSS